jgi:hypothetical protein
LVHLLGAPFVKTAKAMECTVTHDVDAVGVAIRTKLATGKLGFVQLQPSPFVAG